MVGMGVCEGDRIETGPKGRVTLRYLDDATTITAGSGKRATELRLGERGGVKQLRLDQGMISAHVAAQSGGGRLVVTTPHARATVLGTAFSVAVSGGVGTGTGSGVTRVVVDQGRVHLARRGESGGVVVKAGQYSDVTALSESGTNRLVVRPRESLAWRPGRVLWQTDFESETKNREWIAVRILTYGKKSGHEGIEMADPGEVLTFKRRQLGGRDSVVAIMDGDALPAGERLGVRHLRVAEVMQTRTFVLEYDQWTGRGKSGEGAWHRRSIQEANTPEGHLGSLHVDNRFVDGGFGAKPRDLDWLHLFVFSYVRGKKIVDNVAIREFVRGEIALEPDE
jgi:hypothetical protein